MWDNDYDADREDARSDARAEGSGRRRYYANCGEGVCGASDCSTCRNGDDEEEAGDDEEEADDDDEDEDGQVVRGDTDV